MSNLVFGARVPFYMQENDEERNLSACHCDARAEDEPPCCDERGSPDSGCVVGRRTALLCLV